MIAGKYLRALAFSALGVVVFGAGVARAGQLGDVHALQQNPAPTEVTFNVSNIADFDERDAVSNIVKELYVGAGALIYSLKWDVTLTANPGSYLSEMQLTFSDRLGNGVTFTPGDGDDFDGTQRYTGFHDFRPDSQAFHVGGDGVLRLEFHDYYKDLPFDEAEGVWNSGILTFGIAPVPEPETYALMLGGLLLMLSAARRSKAS
ncbi:PEP-CTERM sorting domain-containing protein [Roseateles cellulosilyticus]|uniref:PEP-CTERM sorting domain-containing protein n=1 Tax=Pelomonas cellulosilytica TaxID=2906762 RepID=A0ABS8XLC4_9BURK|nr:PEP-CTERM sorting domain-containing protein [Pelomonas sp. P8]MCE4553607.1 PEP-CTERM sorting domain-containing protein [Pelomonas sp. P8]